MASSTLQKLLGKPVPPTLLFLNSLHPLQQAQYPFITPPPQQLHHHQPSPTPSPTHHFHNLFFPTFPFGFSPTPPFPSSHHPYAYLEPTEPEQSGTTFWADSVKKKRKRKMNKHKYQKLRKRIRRQS